MAAGSRRLACFSRVCRRRFLRVLNPRSSRSQAFLEAPGLNLRHRELFLQGLKHTVEAPLCEGVDRGMEQQGDVPYGG